MGAPPPGTPQITPPKLIFSMAQARVPVFYDIRRYLTDKYFDIVWGCHAPEDSQNGPLKNEFFERLNL